LSTRGGSPLPSRRRHSATIPGSPARPASVVKCRNLSATVPGGRSSNFAMKARHSSSGHPSPAQTVPRPVPSRCRLSTQCTTHCTPSPDAWPGSNTRTRTRGEVRLAVNLRYRCDQAPKHRASAGPISVVITPSRDLVARGNSSPGRRIPAQLIRAPCATIGSSAGTSESEMVEGLSDCRRFALASGSHVTFTTPPRWLRRRRADPKQPELRQGQRPGIVGRRSDGATGRIVRS